MNFRKTRNYEAMSKAAAEWIAAEVKRKADSLICLATGETPTRTYELLAERAKRTPKMFSRIRALKLDEWHGMAAGEMGTCEEYLQRLIVRPWRITPRRYGGFVSDSKRPERECARVQNWLGRNGPIDLCVLGLGVNGHLGLNEPGEALSAFAHVAKLAASTRNHGMLKQRTVKPTRGLTVGMAEILQSRKILLLVSGARKQKALRRLMRGEITTQFPASLLWMHPDATILHSVK